MIPGYRKPLMGVGPGQRPRLHNRLALLHTRRPSWKHTISAETLRSSSKTLRVLPVQGKGMWVVAGNGMWGQMGWTEWPEALELDVLGAGGGGGEGEGATRKWAGDVAGTEPCRCYINSRWVAQPEAVRRRAKSEERMPAAKRSSQHPGEGPCGARRWTRTHTHTHPFTGYWAYTCREKNSIKYIDFMCFTIYGI